MAITFLIATGLEENLPTEGAVGQPFLTRDTQRLLFGGGPGAQMLELNVRLEDVLGLLSSPGGPIRPDLIPPVAIHNAVTAESIAARDQMLADGDVQAGDLVVVADNGDGRRQSYVLLDDGETWVASGGDGAVQSVNGSVGDVVLTTDEINEGTRLYFTETRVGQYIAGITNKAGGVAGVNAQGKLSISVLPNSVLRTGDDAARLGSGEAPEGALLSATGDGETEWTTVIDAGSF